jgi:hypothetical protein
LDEFKAGILIDDLPQTFRDAVDVTRRLKVPYLWIDSLCIIQNTIEDWNKEALQMSAVYQHAICNVAATGALDCTKGLFFKQDLFALRPCKVQVPACQSPAKSKNIYILNQKF